MAEVVYGGGFGGGSNTSGAPPAPKMPKMPGAGRGGITKMAGNSMGGGMPSPIKMPPIGGGGRQPQMGGPRLPPQGGYMNEGRLPGNSPGAGGPVGPQPGYMNEGRLPGGMSPMPLMPSMGGAVPDRATRMANIQSQYGPGGTGWDNFGGAAPGAVAPGPPQQADPYTPEGGLGSAGNPGSMPGTGGGFMAPGPPQQDTAPQLPPDFMRRIQQMMQSNPQMLMKLLAPMFG
jgi:hypothetical protein